MASHKYEIRGICGDWALDIHWGNRIIALYFNSRNNAELVKSILEWEDEHPNEAVPYKPTLTPPNEPLTLDELRQMDGEPVYIVFLPDATGEKLQFWALVDVDAFGDVNLTNNLGGSSPYEEAIANIEAIYRRPPEGDCEIKDYTETCEECRFCDNTPASPPEGEENT